MNTELKKRIYFTLFIIFLYRIGGFIPLPGINYDVISSYFSESSSSLFGIINLFSGGSFERMSIFALNIMPYITSSIIVQLFLSGYGSSEKVDKSSEDGRKKINKYTKLMTVILAFVQSMGIYYTFSNLENSAFISNSSIFLLTTVLSIVAGSLVVVWLGDRITSNGIGNGISMIIFVGIVSSIPSSFSKILNLAKNGVHSPLFVLISLTIVFGIIIFIIFCEKIVRKIKIQYPNMGYMSTGTKDMNNSFIPLKINMSGVMPAIFASSAMTFPFIIAEFFSNSFASVLINYIRRGTILYFVLFGLLIIFFAFFYLSISFDSKKLSENLQKSNSFISGTRPGKNTEAYFNKIAFKLTYIGSFYLAVVCIVPEIITSKYAIPLSIGGTGFLIIVNVVEDLIIQVQSYLYQDKYKSMNKVRKIKVRR